MKTLYSRKELSERWGVSVTTLDRRIKEGKISPTNTTGHPRFHIDDILKSEGTDNSKMSPFERRRLERKIEELEEENQELKDKNEGIKKQLVNVVAEIMPILQEESKSELSGDLILKKREEN